MTDVSDVAAGWRSLADMKMYIDKLYGAVVYDQSTPHASSLTLFGCPMTLDPSLPPNVVEFRDSSGAVTARVVAESPSPVSLFNRLCAAFYGR